MPVRLTVERGPHRGVSAREILRRARRVARALRVDGSQLSIVLTRDDEIHALNRDYRKKDRPTDVLAFAMQEGEVVVGREDLLGDVIISIETARKQAEKAGHDVLAEVTMLMVHGILHLLGWDHDTPRRTGK